MKKIIKTALAASLVFAGATTAAIADDAWPTQSVKLLVGYAAGGPVDTTARVFARYLGDALGQTVVVDNRPGASGIIAAESTSRSPSDGYTLHFIASPTLTITPLIQKNVRLDRDKGLTYIGKIVNYTNVLVANNDVPVKNIAELVEYAKSNPTAVTYGSAGMGASNHLSAELLSQKTESPMLHVPYRGNAPAMVDVMSGETTFMFDIVSTAATYINAGSVRALAVTSPERNATLPDVPSMVEAGVEDYDVTGWYALVGPADMPEALTLRIAEAVQQVGQNADFEKTMIEGGYTISLSDGAELKALVDREYTMWEDVIEQAGIVVD